MPVAMETTMAVMTTQYPTLRMWKWNRIKPRRPTYSVVAWVMTTLWAVHKVRHAIFDQF